MTPNATFISIIQFEPCMIVCNSKCGEYACFNVHELYSYLTLTESDYFSTLA